MVASQNVRARVEQARRGGTHFLGPSLACVVVASGILPGLSFRILPGTSGTVRVQDSTTSHCDARYEAQFRRAADTRSNQAAPSSEARSRALEESNNTSKAIKLYPYVASNALSYPYT